MASQPVGLQQSIRFGEDYELEFRPRRLLRGTHVLKLERIPLELLVLLLEHRGEIVTRDQIVSRIWGHGVFMDTDNSVRGAVRKLRQVLKDDAEAPRFIETITGQGYRFIAPVINPTEASGGEVPGPQILMAGDIFPKNGHPVYLPPEMQLPEAATTQEAEQMTQQYMKVGFDGLKLFTGAFMGNKPAVIMPLDMVKAAVDVAHSHGKPVFAHPQNRAGTDNALNGGVDILAHTIPPESFTVEELAQMKKQHTALIPTLTLWTVVAQDPKVQAKLVEAGVSGLKSYFAEGGTILFGTDVGFTSKYDTTQEYELMGQAMGWKDILASLTTNPTEYFKASAKGRVEKGMDADFVVLDADPAADAKNLAKVKYTVRGGKVIYEQK